MEVRDGPHSTVKGVLHGKTLMCGRNDAKRNEHWMLVGFYRSFDFQFSAGRFRPHSETNTHN